MLFSFPGSGFGKGRIVIDARFPAAPTGHLQVARRADRETTRLSLVVPTFNESGNIGPLLESIREYLDPVLDGRYEVIVVDDNSPDGTWEVAARVSRVFPQLRVMRRMDEQGLSSAVIRGWQVARGEVLGTINADFQHPPSVFPEMIRKMETADLVVATRYAQGGSVGEFAPHRRFSSTFARGLGMLLAPEVFGRVSDPLSGFYIFRRQSIEGVEMRPAGFKTLIEILGRGSVERVAECGYEMGRRRSGRSNVRWRHTVEYLVQLGRIRMEAKRLR
jgi:dolichol-phosphate mannosyltransferase